MTEAVTRYYAGTDVKIQSHREAIETATLQLEEIEDIKVACREEIAENNRKLVKIGSSSDLRRQQIFSLKQQYDLLSKKYNESCAYADLMHHADDTDTKEKAVSAMHDAQEKMLYAQRLYSQSQVDSDQAEGMEATQRKELEHEHACAIEMLAGLDMRKRAILEGREAARAVLGDLLCVEAMERVTRFQADLVSKENELEAAKYALERCLSQELRKLEGYPQLQRKIKSLVPFQDEVSILLDQVIALLQNYLSSCERSVPTLQKLTGEKLIRSVLEGNRLTLDRVVDQIRSHDVSGLRAATYDLKSVLQNYVKNGVQE